MTENQREITNAALDVFTAGDDDEKRDAALIRLGLNALDPHSPTDVLTAFALAGGILAAAYVQQRRELDALRV